MNLIPLIVSLSLLLMGAAVLKAGEMQRLRSSLVAYQLQFPRQLEADAATAFISGLSGLLLPWWRRWRGEIVKSCGSGLLVTRRPRSGFR